MESSRFSELNSNNGFLGFAPYEEISVIANDENANSCGNLHLDTPPQRSRAETPDSHFFETAHMSSVDVPHLDDRISYLRQQLEAAEKEKARRDTQFRFSSTNPFINVQDEHNLNHAVGVPREQYGMAANVPGTSKQADVNVHCRGKCRTTNVLNETYVKKDFRNYASFDHKYNQQRLSSTNPFLQDNAEERAEAYNRNTRNKNHEFCYDNDPKYVPQRPVYTYSAPSNIHISGAFDRHVENYDIYNNKPYFQEDNVPKQPSQNVNRKDQFGKNIYRCNNTGNLFDDYDVQQGKQSAIVDNRYRLNFGDLVPEFDPSKALITSEKWLSNIENLATLYVSNEKVLLHHAMLKLRGAAKFWFDGLTSSRDLTWSSFKNNLMAAFPSHTDEADIHFLLTKRCQKINETFEEYFYEMIAIARRGKIGDTAIIKYVIMGLLNADLRKSLSVSQISSLDDLLGRVKWADNFKNQDQTRTSNISTPSGTAIRRSTPKCFNCNQLGHLSFNCKEKPRLPRCEKCNRTGHETSKCFKRDTIEKPIQHVTEEQELQDEVMEPFFIRTIIDTVKVLCLIDTGSPINLLKSKIVKSERHMLPISNLFTYTGLNKSKLDILGVVYLPVLINKISIEVKFHVVTDETMSIDCVLGGEFFQIKDIQVDIDGTSGETFIKASDSNKTKINKDDIFFSELCHINVDSDYVTIDVGDSGTTLEQNALVTEVFNTYYSTAEPDAPENEHTMIISVTKDQPFYFSPRRFSFKEQTEINEIVQDLLQKGTIRESTSPYASRIVLQNKKDGSKRMCIDFREINKRTVRDVHPLPLIDDQLDQLRGKRYFSLIDLKSGFHHINLDEESRKYTAFVTSSGQYEYTKVPFGLCNGPAVFTRFISQVLKPLLKDKTIQVYIDDILLGTETIEEHINVLQKLFDILRKNKLSVQIKKCHFLKTKIDFLGYEVSAIGIKPSDRHVEAVKNFPIPKNVHELYRFIGLTSFFRRFIQNHSILAKPLYDLIRKDTAFVFGEEQLHAFEILKERLVTDPVLRIYNPKAETELHTDASSLGFGGCLLQKQEDDGVFHPIMYFSKRATAAESKYHSFELETVALIYSLNRFRVYLHGLKFTIVTDCNALKQTLAKQELNAKISRWALELQCYDYTIVHREARRMQHVDALSRNLNIMVLEEGCFEQTLAFHQMKDPKIKHIRDKLRKCESKFFELNDGLVYRKVNNRILFYVPDLMQSNVISKNHDDVGHAGIDKVVNRILRVYWFPDLRLKVKTHIENCLKCITFNPKYGRKEGWLHPIDKGNVPFNTIHVDHLGPLEKTPRGYKYVLVITDAFTKYVKIFPTKTTNSKEAIKSLEKYFDDFSCPVRLIADRGSGFTSKQFKNFTEKHRIVLVLNATASPQSNGQVEIMNKFLVPVLSKLVNHGKKITWDKVLVEVEHTFNNTLNKSIRTTPSQALFGVHQKRSNDDMITVYLENLLREDRDLDQIRHNIQEANNKAQDEYKRQFDKKRKAPHEYSVGDYVMLRNIVTEAGVNHKLLPKFKGPYIVSKILGNDRYVVTDVPGFQISRRRFEGTFSPPNMKPWMQTNDIENKNDDELDIESCNDGGSRRGLNV